MKDKGYMKTKMINLQIGPYSKCKLAMFTGNQTYFCTNMQTVHFILCDLWLVIPSPTPNHHLHVPS